MIHRDPALRAIQDMRRWKTADVRKSSRGEFQIRATQQEVPIACSFNRSETPGCCLMQFSVLLTIRQLRTRA
jgi:hypothetical protein